MVHKTNMTPTQEAILQTIKTKDDRDRLLQEIETILASHYHADPSLVQTTVSKGIRPALSEKFERLISEVSSDPNHRTLEEVCQELEHAIRALKVIFLTIAFDPPQESIDLITSWVKTNIGNIVLDIEYNKHLLGGVIISYQGNYRDLTTKKILKQRLQEKKDDILSLIR